jgi:heme exporter protein CcmB
MTLAGTALVLATKDLRIEGRTRSALLATLTLGAAALVIVGLAAGPNLAQLRSLAPALTAVAVLFASLVMADRLDAIDRENEAIVGLWLALEDRRAIYIGKVIALTALLAGLGLAMWSLAVFLLDVAVGATFAGLLPLVLVAAAAAAAATTLVAAIVGGGEQRALLLPVLLLPMLVPTLLASVNGSRALIEGDGSAAIGWTLVLVAEAALFAGLGLLAYEIVAVPE